MKLHDLQIGQRFTFTDKHRGKVFEVVYKRKHDDALSTIQYEDVATGQVRSAFSDGVMFRKNVELEQPADRFTPDERKLLDEIFSTAYLLECDEENRAERKSTINALHGKLTGIHGRRVVLPEGEQKLINHTPS